MRAVVAFLILVAGGLGAYAWFNAQPSAVQSATTHNWRNEDGLWLTKSCSYKSGCENSNCVASYECSSKWAQGHRSRWTQAFITPFELSPEEICRVCVCGLDGRGRTGKECTCNPKRPEEYATRGDWQACNWCELPACNHELGDNGVTYGCRLSEPNDESAFVYDKNFTYGDTNAENDVAADLTIKRDENFDVEMFALWDFESPAPRSHQEFDGVLDEAWATPDGKLMWRTCRGSLDGKETCCVNGYGQKHCTRYAP